MVSLKDTTFFLENSMKVNRMPIQWMISHQNDQEAGDNSQLLFVFHIKLNTDKLFRTSFKGKSMACRFLIQ
jgi:hypothetical protein